MNAECRMNSFISRLSWNNNGKWHIIGGYAFNCKYFFSIPAIGAVLKGWKTSQMRSYAIQICVHANHTKCIQHHMVFTLLWIWRDRPWAHRADTETSAHMICMQIWWLCRPKKSWSFCGRLKLYHIWWTPSGSMQSPMKRIAAIFHKKLRHNLNRFVVFRMPVSQPLWKFYCYLLRVRDSSKSNNKKKIIAKTNSQFTRCIF